MRPTRQYAWTFFYFEDKRLITISSTTWKYTVLGTQYTIIVYIFKRGDFYEQSIKNFCWQYYSFRFNSFSKDEGQYIKPIVIDGANNEVENAILSVINTMENSKVTESDNSYIRAEFSSDFFGFVDDVEFYFPENESEKTIYIRSAARLGYSDFNVNRERIERIRLRLETLKK